MGPNIIFDKSFLQSLNRDEAVWLDQFFYTVMTPLFFVETLADLEKEDYKGRTPEQVVGNLAYKTPDRDVVANSHHRTILQGELTGVVTVDMKTGRPTRVDGRDVRLNGEHGVVFDVSPEEEAFARWQNRDFLHIERNQARAWRDELSSISPVDQKAKFQGWFGAHKPRGLEDVKAYADDYIDGENQKSVLSFGLSLFDVNPEVQSEVLRRWDEAGQPTVREFAPYFRHVYGIELFFYLARSADLISGRQTNKVDMAYLYYLPFCMVFASNDKLHQEVVPLFLRPDQSFVWGPELKADFVALDHHYDALPATEKEKGTDYFAPRPPADRSFLVTRLWDRHMRPDWRGLRMGTMASGAKLEPDLLAKIRRANQAAKTDPVTPDKVPEKIDFIISKHKVMRKKGKWVRFPKVQKPLADESDG